MAGGTPHADVYAARLGDSSLGLFAVLVRGWDDWDDLTRLTVDAKLKLQIAGELRDSIDMFTHTPAEYTRFLLKLMPVFTTILSGQPVFISTSPEQVCNCHWSFRLQFS